MNITKNRLLSFIRKYNLGGEVQTVLWTIKDNILNVKFIIDDESLRGEVNCENVDHEDLEFVIYETDPLIKMLSVLDDNNFDVTISPIALNFKDGNSKLKYVLADKSLGRRVKNVTYPKDFITIYETEDILTKFTKALSSFTRCEIFGIIADELESKIIFSMREGSTVDVDESNLSEQKTHTFNIDIKSEEVTLDIPMLNFNSKRFKSIIDTNKGFTMCKIKIFKVGMLELIFKHEDDKIDTNYQLVALQK